MYKFLKNLSCLLCLVVIFSGCRKKALEDYYNPPANLAPPIYQVLQSRGNFTNLLTVIDRSGYKATLSTGGYWTFFAPNDAAFQKYFTANATSLDKIDSVTAGKIVRYCLVFNAFQTNHLADYQSPTGYVPNGAYKRRTAYYDGFMFGNIPAGPNGSIVNNGVFVSENRNAGTFSYGDNNNKYIPYFYSTFMTQAGLSATDYNYFFPNTTYTGFNVANATVVNKDIVAENGVIHEIDQVVLPLPSIEQKLASNSQYSVFKNLYEQYLVTYVANASYTRQYNTVTQKTDQVYIKTYATALNFALGNESYLKFGGANDDSQTDGYTLFAPTNTVLTTYLNNVILKYYKTLAALPLNILTDFMNAHMFVTTVWPSKFGSRTNQSGEPARFDPNADVVDRQFCSNGLFYGVSKVQAANVFSTVYARAYLDPAYSIMNKLLDASIKASVTNPSSRFTIFMLPDVTLRAMGYDYNSLTGVYSQTTNGVTSTAANVVSNLQRILNLQTVSTPNNELNDLSGDGIIETNGGEYIRWHNNTIASAGSVENNRTVSIVGSDDYSNGRVYYLNNTILDLPAKSILQDIQANAVATTDPYYDFYQYLINSGAYNPGAVPVDILGIQAAVKYTVFVPTKAAMQQAVLDGYLPGQFTVNPTTGVKTFVQFTYKPTTTSDQTLVTNFINYHILNGITIVPDGKKGNTGQAFPTLLKNLTGDAITVTVFNTATGPGNGTLIIKDRFVRSANVLPQNNNPLAVPGQTSNYLGTYAVIHQIDNYLRYSF